jgi:capsule polysaccharide export protein KpsE/RkpR
MLPIQEKINEKQQESQTILQQVEKLEKEMTQIHTKLNSIKSHMATFVAQIEKEDAIILELNESTKKKSQEVEVLKKSKSEMTLKNRIDCDCFPFQ